LQQIIRSDDARSPFGSMARPQRAGSIATVLAQRSRALVDASAPHVYGAALAAAAGPAVAEEVTHDVMLAAVLGRARADARSLIERAVVRAVRRAPHAAFARMAPGEREVVALARLAGYSVGEIAAALEIEPDEARSRMSSGLRAVSRDAAPRMPPPRPGCGSGASPAGGERAS
jgi:DNA-directed RNA polymerase specialized sigma24 family protein